MNLTQKRLREVMQYDPETGQFTWIKTLSQRAVAGTPSGNPYSNGYLRSCIDGEEILCHRLAWLYMTGEFPDFEIDHKNRVRNDNSWDNLRASTGSQNKCNTTIRKDNSSGVKGVSWNSKRERWYASICVNGNRKHLGSFLDLESAKEAIESMRKTLHGEFSNS